MTPRLLAAALVALPSAAHAAPPPVGSDDWNVMAPYAQWVTTQHAENGNWCCDISDGRPVDARINAEGHWEAHVTSEHWPLAHDHWVEVPDVRVLHTANPTGLPIMWYSVPADHVYCFAPGSGT
jgi:hypothetical protein